ncbi:hypothetical protein Xind_00002 [Xenorhabdus indica]|nr:hypothetical protein [Xenorhabdus indica]
MHDKVTGTFIKRENYKLYLIYVSNYLIHDQLALAALFQFNSHSAPALTSYLALNEIILLNNT